MRANYKVELASGLFLLLGMAALIWLATAATNLGTQISGEVYWLSADFTNIGDLKPRAPVKLGGVTIGVVDQIDLDLESFNARVTMNIDRRFDAIPDDTSAAILTSGVLGDRYIGFEPGGSPDVLQEGDEILITQSAVVLEQLVGKYLFNTDSKEGEQ